MIMIVKSMILNQCNASCILQLKPPYIGNFTRLSNCKITPIVNPRNDIHYNVRMTGGMGSWVYQPGSLRSLTSAVSDAMTLVWQQPVLYWLRPSTSAPSRSNISYTALSMARIMCIPLAPVNAHGSQTGGGMWWHARSVSSQWQAS